MKLNLRKKAKYEQEKVKFYITRKCSSPACADSNPKKIVRCVSRNAAVENATRLNYARSTCKKCGLAEVTYRAVTI